MTLQPTQLSSIEHCVTQYDIVRRVAGNLRTVDLFRLACTSKSAWNSIKESNDSWTNLNNMTQCDGYGVQYRRSGREAYERESRRNRHGIIFANSIKCGADASSSAETKLCVSCCRAVCDECRIHVAYNGVLTPAVCGCNGLHSPVCPRRQQIRCVTFLDNSHVYEIDIRSDFGLSAGAVLAPDHGKLKRSIGLSIEKAINAPLESLTRTSIGDTALMLINSRVRQVCRPCLENDGWGFKDLKMSHPDTQTPLGSYRCKCTLRSRFLDRWICIPCYKTETGESIEALRQEKYGYVFSGYCACGKVVTTYRAFEDSRDLALGRLFCMWCGGRT